jgi:hypothetical protein
MAALCGSGVTSFISEGKFGCGAWSCAQLDAVPGWASSEEQRPRKENGAPVAGPTAHRGSPVGPIAFLAAHPDQQLR